MEISLIVGMKELFYCPDNQLWFKYYLLPDWDKYFN